MLSQLFDDLKQAGGWVAAAVLGGLGIWHRVSKTRASVSGDAVKVAENASKAAWIDGQDERLASERRLREAAEAREREMFERLQQAQGALLLSDERERRLEQRVRWLAEIAAAARPELPVDWLLTAPAELDDDEPKGPT